MKTLELKHLAPYLPYGLKYQSQHIEGIRVYKILGINIKNDTIQCDNDYGWSYIKGIKPILRPLSDLLAVISIDGEEFIPTRKIMSLADNQLVEDFVGHIIDFSARPQDINIEAMPWQVAVQLFQWHFDVFGLIDAGLAVDINTIN